MKPCLAHGLLASLVLTLAACGGSSEESQVTLSGSVVKGPVAAASVCAYDLATGARGPRLGACATTAADGRYALEVPADIGPVLLEASGGTFTDEMSGANAALPAPLRSVVAPQGAAATAVLTPFTTIATNAALAAGPVTAASFAARLEAVRTAWSLPAGVDLARTVPALQDLAAAYTQAFRAYSQMVANGAGLAGLLGASDPAALASAYAQALAQVSGAPTTPTTPTQPTTPTTPTQPTTPTTPTTPAEPTTPTEPTTPATPTTPTAPTASAAGSLAVTGGRSPTFTPQADGFTVTVKPDGVTYRFFVDNRTASGGATLTLTSWLEIRTNVAGAVIGASFNDPKAALDVPFTCLSNCGAGLTIQPAPGATRPVSFIFSGVKVGAVTLNGTLVGDASGALWRVQDLPRSTDGLVRVNGSNVGIVRGSYQVTTGTFSTHRAEFLLEDGATVLLDGPVGGNLTTTYVRGTTIGMCVSGCAATLAATTGGAIATFNATALSGGITLGNTIFIGASGGSLSSPTLGSFTPAKDSAKSENADLTYSFDVLGTPSQSGISLVTVTFRNGVVQEAGVTTGIGLATYSCFREALAALSVPACSGITLGADRRTITFSGAALGNRQGTATIQGTLKAKGL